MATVQIPAILMPYGRAALTALFATAGLPGIIMPLINQVLIVQLTGGTVNQTNWLLCGTFEAAVFDTALDKNIWKAKIDVQGTRFEDVFAGELVTALKKDSLIAELAPANWVLSVTEEATSSIDASPRCAEQ